MSCPWLWSTLVFLPTPGCDVRPLLFPFLLSGSRSTSFCFFHHFMSTSYWTDIFCLPSIYSSTPGNAALCSNKQSLEVLDCMLYVYLASFLYSLRGYTVDRDVYTDHSCQPGQGQSLFFMIYSHQSEHCLMHFVLSRNLPANRPVDTLSLCSNCLDCLEIVVQLC